jgi:hypothetical protein
MTTAELATWPAVRDVVRELSLSQCYVNIMIHDGRLDAVCTRLGWLVDPESVARLKAERAARLAQKRAVTA